MLAELVTLPESGVVRVPDHLSYEEASTLPVAALTAWNAVMESGPRMAPGATVLTLGTGGVSLFAIQLALGQRLTRDRDHIQPGKGRAPAGFWASRDVINYREISGLGAGSPATDEWSGRRSGDRSCRNRYAAEVAPSRPSRGAREPDRSSYRIQRSDRYVADSLQEGSASRIWGRARSNGGSDGAHDCCATA